MVQPITSALAGLRAAEIRVGVAAENIANAHSTGSGPDDVYRAKIAVQSTDATGVPSVTVTEKPEVNLEDTGSFRGPVIPTVNLAKEIVDLKLASHSYRANAIVLETAAELEGELIVRLGGRFDQDA